jgi:xanthine/CO dehydrogenase XdhC/CoxF family maturation factor
MDDGVLEALLAGSAAGRPAVLATVVRARGSTPRGAGSRMLLGADGRLVGTIGGGCGEGDVIAAAPAVLRDGRPRLLRVELTDAIDTWSPAVCGGVMEILLEPVLPASSGARPATGTDGGTGGAPARDGAVG